MAQLHSTKSEFFERNEDMIQLFPHPLSGRPIFRGRKRFSRHSTFRVLKTVDAYEQLIVDPRASSPRKNKLWEGGRRIGVVSFIIFLFFLVGCLLAWW
jgi:hypothetical protein